MTRDQLLDQLANLETPEPAVFVPHSALVAPMEACVRHYAASRLMPRVPRVLVTQRVPLTSDRDP